MADHTPADDADQPVGGSEMHCPSGFPDTMDEGDNPYMPGRLRRCWTEWEKLDPSCSVRSVILHGYRLPWADGKPPPQLCALTHQRLMLMRNLSSKIQEVTESGVVRTCKREDLVCMLPINVLPKPKSDKLRLILNGSPLKPYAVKRKFKLEQIWKEVREVLGGCTHGSVIDISNAFFHVEIAENSKQYLGFE